MVASSTETLNFSNLYGFLSLGLISMKILSNLFIEFYNLNSIYTNESESFPLTHNCLVFHKKE